MAIATSSPVILIESTTLLPKTVEPPPQPVLVMQWVKVNGCLESRWVHEVP